jgi:hypothetical protein
MTLYTIICSNPYSTSNWSWNLPVTSFPIHISLQIRSWQHYFKICSNPQYTRILVMTSSSNICSNQRSISNWSWKLSVTTFPINIKLQIRSWYHYFRIWPIHRAPQIWSLHHHLSSVLIHIFLQICRESFLWHPIQSIYHFIIGQDHIHFHLYQSTYHLKLGNDIIFYHLF